MTALAGHAHLKAQVRTTTYCFREAFPLDLTFEMIVRSGSPSYPPLSAVTLLPIARQTGI